MTDSESTHNKPNIDPKDCLDMEVETQKISMTITEKSAEWLEKTYPEAQSTQESIRMAMSDARKHVSACNSLEVANDD